MGDNLNVRKEYKILKSRFIKLLDKYEIAGEVVRTQALDSDFLKLPPDYPLMKGKEVLLDCELRGVHGQAYTDEPKIFQGRIAKIADNTLEDNSSRALFFSALNALMALIGEISNPVHCTKTSPERCGVLLAEHIMRNFGKTVKVAHIGYQPGHVKATSRAFRKVYVTDLDPDNIGKLKFGIRILDGSSNEEVIKKVDVACITGSSIVNGTLFDLLDWCEEYGTKPIIYGVSAKGAMRILGCEVFCPLARDRFY